MDSPSSSSPTTAFASSVPFPFTKGTNRQVNFTSIRPSPIPNIHQSPRVVMDQQSTSSSSPPKSTAANFNAEKSIRPELVDMAPYTPILPYDVLASRLGRDPSTIVKLDANENPYGPAPSVRDALASSPYLHIYPDPESASLRTALSSYTSIPPEYLLAGAGADELIDLLFRLFITPGAGDAIVNCPPTFGMYKFDADVNGAVIHNIPRMPDFSIDVSAIDNLFNDFNGKPPKMVFIASPNNPDGSVITDDDLKRLLQLPTLIVLDEAYFEFADDNRLEWVPTTPNLVVLRTFSKWAGLAGMRLGYGAFPLDVIKHLWKVKQPYNVSVASQTAGIASINEKEDLLHKVQRMVKQRYEFYERVKSFEWLKPYPSQSNYVLCRVGGGRVAADVKTELANRGILIRYYTTPRLADCIRISMGTEEQMERFYEAIAEL